MSRIDITSTGAPLSDGILQTANPLDATLQVVTDNVGTSSTLLLSTAETQINSTLRIKTDNAEILDIENSSGNRFNINRSVQNINLDFASKPTDLTTQVGAIRTAIDGTNLADVIKFQENGQVTLTERVKLESDSTVTTQTSSVIQASTIDSSLVLAPNGTGNILGNIPDGAAAGGISRGQYSIDLQLIRNLSNQVVKSNYSGILSGRSNRISNTGLTAGAGDYSVIVGGSGNTIDNTTGGGSNFIGGGGSNTIPNNSSFATIGGGSGNSGTSSGYAYWTVGGGASNNASSNYATVSGGQSNTASTNTHATVVGGQSNTASGQYSVAGGQSNTASGQYSISIGGFNNISNSTGTFSSGGSNQSTSSYSTSIGLSNTASGAYSVAMGAYNSSSGQSSTVFGYAQSATADYSSAFGSRCLAYLPGQLVNAGGYISIQGDAQQSLLTSYKLDTLNTGGTTILSLNGSGTSGLLIPNSNNRAWNVQVNWVAVVTAITGTATGISVGDVVTSVDLLAFKRVGGTSSASVHTSAATKTMVTTPAAYAACAIAYTAGANQQMAMTFTGPTFVGGGSVTMRVVARIELSEVAW